MEYGRQFEAWFKGMQGTREVVYGNEGDDIIFTSFGGGDDNNEIDDGTKILGNNGDDRLYGGIGVGPIGS